MLDIQFIRDNSDLVKQKSKDKAIVVDVSELLKVDMRRRELLQAAEQLREERNNLSDSSKGSKPSGDNITRSKILKDELSEKEKELGILEVTYTKLLKQIPNMPTEDTPVGASVDDNKVEYERGAKPEFDFEPKNHWQIGEAKGWIDKRRAAKVAGARFVYIKGDLALLSNALMRYGVDVLSNEEILKQIARGAGLKISTKPFVFVLPPLMIREEVYDAMDRLEPREDRYQIAGTDLWLQGSAEHVLGSMHFEEVLEETDLPIRYVGLATSFRQEAGSYGKDLEGITRLHQFEKLEMESLAKPEDSLNEHLFMIAIQEYLMSQLKLPYRKILKSTFDIGKPNARGVDLEAWLPSQQKYMETHTADYMTDYQSRRLKTRFKSKDGSLRFVHTNDATALAQRPLIAIIDNFQTEDGKVAVPEVLVPYMGGKTEI